MKISSSNVMNCAQAASAFQPFLEGERMPGLREHVDACPECRLRLTTASALFQALGGLPAIEPPVEFPAMIMARLHREENTRHRWSTAGLASIAVSLCGLTALLLPPALKAAWPWLLRGLTAGSLWLADAASFLLDGLGRAFLKVLPLVLTGERLATTTALTGIVALGIVVLLAAEVAGMSALAVHRMRVTR
jgi:hypothetical protein